MLVAKYYLGSEIEPEVGDKVIRVKDGKLLKVGRVRLDKYQLLKDLTCQGELILDRPNCFVFVSRADNKSN